MINFRNIFNLNYSYLILFSILILFILLYFILKDNRKFIKFFSNINLICGIITLIFALVIKLTVDNISNYRLFIEVISNNIFNELIYLSMVNLLLWLICLIFSLLLKKEKHT